MVDDSLRNNRLTPPQAATLAGKLAFLATTTSGRMGRAATKAIYQRQHSLDHRHQVDQQLRASLHTIRWLLRNTPPRRVTTALTPQLPAPMLYTGAYFLDGERRQRPHELLAQV